MSRLLPEYGWHRRGSDEFPERRTQNLRPSPSQLADLIPLSFRYLRWYFDRVLFRKKKPNIDQIRAWTGKRNYGVPLGGIGAGTIGRGFRGDFRRYQLIPGMYDHETINGNQFIVVIERNRGESPAFKSVLSLEKQSRKVLSAWEWKVEDIEYVGLYPRSWTLFNIPSQGVRLLCQQISPFIPHNYKDSCLPASVFLWSVFNDGDDDVKVTVIQTVASGFSGKIFPPAYAQSYKDTVQIHQDLPTRPGMRLSLVLSVSGGDRIVHYDEFDPNGDGKDFWNALSTGGNCSETKPTKGCHQVAAALGVQVALKPKSSSEYSLKFAFCWDCPEIRFRDCERIYKRRYTRWFAAEKCETGSKLAEYSLNNVENWISQIEAWQNPILDDKELPDWFKSALFNEMYFIADGGTQWLELSDDEKSKLSLGDPRIEFGRFAYLEAQEYTMYNTYDVHFYASFALIALFPGIQASIQADFVDATLCRDKERVRELYGGRIIDRNSLNAVPHDLGDPDEEPFVKVNSYVIHDVSEWRDLPVKLVLSIWRDVVWLKDLNHNELSDWLANYSWSACQTVMDQCLEKFDTDNDGLIENSGRPDQTYDSWIMKGTSAYCGGLWLAAVAVMGRYAEEINDLSVQAKWEGILKKAQKSFFEKLWNGEFFDFDDDHDDKKIIMSDQLCGQWYLRLTGGFDNRIFPKDKVDTALDTIFKYNVCGFNDGRCGAVNGIRRIDGKIDRTTIQSEEVWTGVTYALASLMIAEGKIDEGFRTAQGIYETVYNQIGMGFETPEALYEKKYYRAIGYMRPLSIWSMYEAWKKRSNN